MRKFFLSTLGAMALLATSCQKDNLATSYSSGSEKDITVSVNLSSASSTTRAISDYGTGAEINRCILEVYTSESTEPYKRMVTSVGSSLTASFDLRLVTSQEYTFVAWADNVVLDLEVDNHYVTTNGLDEIELNDVTEASSDYENAENHPNDDTRDAFFGNQTVTVDDATSVALTLKRPFGQLNITTKLTDVTSEMTPDNIKRIVTTDMYRKFNAITGDVKSNDANDGDATVDMFSPSDDFDIIATIENNELHISADYFFAPADGQILVGLNMEFYNTSGMGYITERSIENLPIQRNYRTNVSGELLTTAGHVDVSVVPEFDTEESYQTGDISVADIDALNTLLSTTQMIGDVKFVIANVTSGEQTITIPDNCTAESIAIEIAKIDSDAKVIISSEGYAKTVDIILPIDTQSSAVTVYLPLAHVTFYGNVMTATVSTSPSTFVVLDGSIIGDLTVKSGKAEVYGVVDNYTIEENAATGIKNSTTGAYYLYINDAVKNAVDYDVIEISEGTYYSPVSEIYGSYTTTAYSTLINIKCPLTIKAAEGADPSKVIIDAESWKLGSYGAVVCVSADDVVLEGLTIITNSSGGLSIYGSFGATKIGTGGSNTTILREKGYGKFTM
ncbi:MAG: DUF6562 domain-containing protein, partial [Rikenellaceae bacterium]